ncbi:chitin deacetylase 8 isoform X4 [Dermacentor silvarum]|uniref:chitin deacetylase 8 isoform X4 n=1 Tax=Dermacentor silvarum TaxID=543639 RepID=UPI0021011453|nr:chitin deacetylase 8 isoform X4 [Dermacentor silvarum]
MARYALSLLFIALCAWETIVAGSLTKCDPSQCSLRDNCLCPSTRPPANLSASSMPQFVMLTFDDAVNEENMDFYRQLLGPGRRRNRANGCNLAATFFVSAGYTDYSLVHELHSVGNEIAIHSITHLDNLSYWRTLDVAGWEAEFVVDRELLRDYALIPEWDMVGARAPYLEAGNGESYDMMQRNGFVYDSSFSIDYMNEPDKLPFFPYTLDYGLGFECTEPSCPSGSHRGLWLVPLNCLYGTTLHGDGSRTLGSSCPMPATCTPQPTTEEDTLDFLRSNFERYYHTNRAPFPVFTHDFWLQSPGRRQGYLSFVDWLLTMDDVFVVTVAEVVRFMRDPKPLDEYVQTSCSRASEFRRCPQVHSCSFPDAPIKETRRLIGCKPCPESYPWLRDVVRKAKDDARVARKQYFDAGCVLLLCSAFVVCLYVAAKRFGRRKKRFF